MLIYFVCICTSKPLLRRHIDIKKLDLESSKTSSCKYINIFRAATICRTISTICRYVGPTLVPFFDEITGCVLEACNFIKMFVQHRLFFQNIFLRQLVVGTNLKNNMLNGIKVRVFFGKNVEKKQLCRHDKNYYYFCKSIIRVINLIVGSTNKACEKLDIQRESFLPNTNNFLVLFIVFECGKFWKVQWINRT